MSTRTWLVLATALCVLALSQRAPAFGEQSGSRAEASTGVEGLHVVHPPGHRPYLADFTGREVLLRGVDTNALVQYSDRPGCAYQETVPLRAASLDEMAALGFNFLRLGISWSRLEPAPGVFSQAYLGQIRSVVTEAGRVGIAVLVDMHQDRYNRHLWCGQEVDGAPDWATLTAGTPCTPVEISTLCAQVATQAFWSDAAVDGKGLQAWYLGALEAVARAVGAAPNLAGIELMNEPTPGLVGPPAFETTELYPFYRRMIAGLRQSGFVRPIWFEPSVLRDVTDNAEATAVRFSSDPNLVYAVHIYTGVFSEPSGPDDPQAQLVQSYVAAEAEAAAFGTPVVDDEFGSNASGSWDQWLRRELALQDRFVMGSGFWLWQQRPGFYGWAVVRPDGTLRASTERAQLLSLPHPDAVPGRLVALRVEGPGAPDAVGVPPQRLVVEVSSPHGGSAAFWSGTVVVEGAQNLLAAPFASATVDDRPTRASCAPRRFSVKGPKPLVLEGCVVSVQLPPGLDRVVLSPGA